MNIRDTTDELIKEAVNLIKEIEAEGPSPAITVHKELDLALKAYWGAQLNIRHLHDQLMVAIKALSDCYKSTTDEHVRKIADEAARKIAGDTFSFSRKHERG